MLSDKIWKLQSKQRKKKSKDSTHKVNYSWLTKSYSRKCKAFMAYLYDSGQISDLEITNPRFSKRRFFDKYIMPRIRIVFPKLGRKIKKYYLGKGRSLSDNQYVELCFARFNSMYGPKMVRGDEHPTNAGGEIYKDYTEFLNPCESVDDSEGI
jgi:hypothetical protein